MLRFWGWAGTIAATILRGMAVYIIAQRPQETVDAVSKFLEQILSLRQQPWFRNALVFLGGFISGLCLDWLRRKLGRSRADKREALGNEMLISEAKRYAMRIKAALALAYREHSLP